MALVLFSWLQQNLYDWEKSIFMLIMIFIVEVMVTDWRVTTCYVAAILIIT